MAVTFPRPADRRRRLATLAKVLLVIILVLAVVRIVGGSGLFMQHSSGGCNHIPLVNGQPQYQCDSHPGS
jgi:flagellar basal body-associated protein FliL